MKKFLGFLNLKQFFEKDGRVPSPHSEDISFDKEYIYLNVKKHQLTLNKTATVNYIDVQKKFPIDALRDTQSADLYANFILDAKPQDILWLVNQKEIPSLNVKQLFKKYYIYDDVFRKIFEPLVHSYDTNKREKLLAFLNWGDKDKLLKPSDAHHRITQSVQISKKNNIFPLTFFLDYYRLQIDINQESSSGKLLLEEIFVQNVDSTVKECLETDNWRYKPQRLNVSSLYKRSLCVEAMPKFFLEKDKEEFIIERLKGFSIIGEKEVELLFDTFSKHHPSYLEPFIKEPSRLVNMMLSNTEQYLNLRVFHEFAAKVPFEKLKEVHDNLTSDTKLGFYYENILNDVYHYYHLNETLTINKKSSIKIRKI